MLLQTLGLYALEPPVHPLCIYTVPTNLQ